MCKQALTVCLSLGMVFGLVQAASADLVGHWAFDDGAGAIAADSSGNGHDAVVEGGGDAAWVEGQHGTAVEVGNGVWVNVPPEAWAPIDNQFTVAYWSFGYDGLANNWGFFATAAGANRMISNHLPWGDGSVYYDTADAAGAWEAERISQALDPGLATGVWNHWAFTKNTETGDKKIYLNGEVWLTGTNATGPVTEISVFTIGSGANGVEQYLGLIDDFQLHDVELTQEEIQAVMKGVSRELASGPTPEDAKIDVLRNVILSWTPGELAAKHDVYLGTVFTDVNEASATNDLGVLVSQGQADTSYDAGILEFGQTYYWRVDEVNSAPDNTVFKGDVWSFTAEPYSIQIPGDTIAVTASSNSNEFSMAVKAIDGSGLGTDDTHSISPETMWFSASPDMDPWIQFEFDAVQQLDTMKVWNSNGAAEMAIGWGVKDVEIAYSLDGETWTVLEGANQFSRAPGNPSYNAYDEIDFGGVAAKLVRFNIATNWGGLLMSYSLSEVQFAAIPATARTPEPVSGATDVVPNATVAWRAGREAAQHTIYVSSDANAVADGSAPSSSSSINSFDLTSLDLDMGTTYYWRVDEVNEAEATSVWAGPVWSLSTVAALIVDDFESYDNASPDRPFQTWLDGFGYSSDEFFPVGYPGNGTGAGIGHDIWSLSSPHYNGDIMETASTIFGSSQSMPFYYSNSGGVASQTERTFAVPQDWTVGAAQTLSIAFRGQGGNTGTLYAIINNAKVTYSRDAANIAHGAWQAWNIDLSSVGTNLQSVTKLVIGVDGSSASGMLLIDDIKLHAQPGELITPVDPGANGLVALYTFEGNMNDSSGNGHNGTVVGLGGTQVATDPIRGQVLSLPGGEDQYVEIGAVGISGTMPRTIACWAKAANTAIPDWTLIFGFTGQTDGTGGNGSHFNLGSLGGPGGIGAHAWGWEETMVSDQDGLNWHHYAMTYDGTTIAYFVDGMPMDSDQAKSNVQDLSASGDRVHIGSRVTQTSSFPGNVDDAVIYDRTLSAEEILYLSGVTTPIDKPF